jgi:cytochrome c oxidase subunit 2
MRHKRGQMDGVVLALLLVLLVLAAAITVAGSKKFGWWLRPLASEHGAAIDRLFVTTLVITGVVFILVQLLLAFLVFRYRGEAGRRGLSG